MARIKCFFTMAKDEKMTEKCFRQVMITSICSILLCMVCLVSVTWAWFSTSVTATNNVICSGSFETKVTVKRIAEGTEETTTVEKTEDGYKLTENGTYEVTIKNIGTTKGYCLVSINEGADWRNTGTLEVGKEVTISITVENAEVNLAFAHYWGSDPYATDTIEPVLCIGEELPEEEIPEESTEPDEPTDPEPSDSEPTDPEPTDPEPTDPEPTDPEPTDPEPTDPEPTDPEPTNPEPTDPEPTDPEPTDPEPTDPEPTDPEPTNSEPTDLEPSEGE